MRLLLAAIALSCSACAAADEPVVTALAPAVAEWRAVDAETGKIRDIEGLEQLALDFPDSGNVRLRLLQPYLEAGEPEKVLQSLEWLYERGYVFSEVAQSQIAKLLEGVDPGRIAERLIAEAEVIAASEVLATVPAEAQLVESVVRDLDTGGLIATTVNSRSIFAKGATTEWVAVNYPGVDNLSGIVRGSNPLAVWVSSGNIDGSERDPAKFSGLVLLTPPAQLPIRISAPEGVTPSDLAVSSDSTLFTSDPIGGGIYTASELDQELVALVAPGTLRSPQGLAISEDNTKLYVSDYRYGIAIVDLATREVSRLASDIPVILDGVDGMWRHGNELIAVQNGTSPMRISAFELSDDGSRVVGHRILEQANPEWTEPLGGSIDGDALIYVGNGQWDRYVAGELAQDKEALPTQIRRLPLSPQ